MISEGSATKLKKTPFRAQVLNRQRRIKIHRKSVASFCASIFQALDQPACLLSIVFVGGREMRAMNSRYLGRNYATDVLSFPYNGAMVEGMPFLGEIIIAPEVARCQAMRYKASVEREIRKLLVHGTLHLLGYDHETDNGEMNHLQKKLLRRRLFLSSLRVADLVPGK